MNVFVISHFAQPGLPVTPLPAGPTLALPAGDVAVQDAGRLFSLDQWVVAVGVSDRVFLVVRERTEKYIASRRLHELLGYLTACGCELIPVDFRCPLAWRQGSSFAAIRKLWAAHFFDERNETVFAVPLPLSSQPMILLPLATIADDATLFWQEAGAVADALFSVPGSPDRQLRSQLASISARWERRWNEALAQAQATAGQDNQYDRLAQCDRAWATVERKHLRPFGYQMQPASMARLW